MTCASMIYQPNAEWPWNSMVTDLFCIWSFYDRLRVTENIIHFHDEGEEKIGFMFN